MRATVPDSGLALHHAPYARRVIADFNHLDDNFASVLIWGLNKAVPKNRGQESFATIGLRLLSRRWGRDIHAGEIH